MAAATTSMERALANPPGTTRATFGQYSLFPRFIDIESSIPIAQHISHVCVTTPHDLLAVLVPPHRSCIDFPSGSQYSDSGVALLWQYEHLRQICCELNLFVVLLSRVCNPKTCPEMNAESTTTFACAAHPSHEQDIGPATRDCPAILYVIHAIDSATATLSSSKNFPSRVSLAAVTGTLSKTRKIRQPQQQQQESPVEHAKNVLTNVARRLARVFMHAYYSHRSVFDAFEFGIGDKSTKLNNTQGSWLINPQVGHMLYTRFALLVKGGTLREILTQYYGEDTFDTMLSSYRNKLEVEAKRNAEAQGLDVSSALTDAADDYSDAIDNLDCHFEELVPSDQMTIPFKPLTRG